MFACLGLEIITQYLRYQIFVVYQRLFRREICRDYMVMPAFEQGKLSVCTAGKENLSSRSYEQTKLIQEKLRRKKTCMSSKIKVVCARL